MIRLPFTRANKRQQLADLLRAMDEDIRRGKIEAPDPVRVSVRGLRDWLRKEKLAK